MAIFTSRYSQDSFSRSNLFPELSLDTMHAIRLVMWWTLSIEILGRMTEYQVDIFF